MKISLRLILIYGPFISKTLIVAGNDPKANPKEIMQQEKEHKPRKMGTRTWIKGKKQANDSCGVRDGKFERKKVSYS